MGFTIPVERDIGELISKSIWNTDIKDNLRYLKGMDGPVEIEDDILPDGLGQSLGSYAVPWFGYFDFLYSRGYTVSRAIREIIINWEVHGEGDYQCAWTTDGNGAEADTAGIGQVALKVDDNQAGAVYFHPDDENIASFSGAFSTLFNASRIPYFRQEFVINALRTNIDMWIGFRQTLGPASPSPGSENYFGLLFNGGTGIWQPQCANGSSPTALPDLGLSASERYVIEMLLMPGTGVDVWVNGSLVGTLASNLPTGNLEYTFLLDSSGAGGATDTVATFGKTILQEALS